MTIISNSGAIESVIVELGDKVKMNHLNREVISNFLYFATKIEAKSISMSISRKSNDYGKFLI